MRRHGARTVARMHTGFFDMFENTGHHNLIAVAQHIDIQFRGVAQIAVNQNRAVTRTITASRI